MKRVDRADNTTARPLEAYLPPGSPFAHFRILGVLGRGGMATVYRAADLDRGGQEVALKLLSMPKVRDARDEARFRREAQTVAALKHPNIGTVHAVGEHDGQLFLSMPLYDGQTLERRLDRAAELDPIPISEVVLIAAQLAAALTAAHAAGVVHRDVKPANLMLLGGRRLKLLDFGLASHEGAAPLTDPGTAVGTVVYMAPEQVRGAAGGPQADLWSFGAVVYEMLAGRPPFGRGGPQPLQWLIQAILEQEPPPLRELRPDVPPALAVLVDRCLVKDPAARFAGAEEILAELRMSGLLHDPAPGVARHPFRRSLAAAAALLVALGAVSLFRPATLLRVAVPAPEIEGRLSGAGRERLAGKLREATLQALGTLPQIRLAAPAAPDEILTARAYCGETICQIVLQRRRGADGSDLWTDSFEIPAGALDALPANIAPRIRKTYSSEKP